MAFKVPDTPEELLNQTRPRFEWLRKFLPFFIIVFFVSLLTLTSFYFLAAGEVGVIRRLGRYARTEAEGLNWKIPLRVEKLDIVKTGKLFSEEFGSAFTKKSFSVVTRDQAVFEANWAVEFTIKDPVDLLFRLNAPREALRDVTESFIQEALGQLTADDVLALRLSELSRDLQPKIQNRLDRLRSGFRIENLKIKEIAAPEEVRTAFQAFQNARQEKEKILQEAENNRKRAVALARLRAQKDISTARMEALENVDAAKQEAGEFLDVLESYKISPQLTRERLYFDAIEDITAKAGKVYILEPDKSGRLPHLDLQKFEKDHEKD